MYKDDLAQVYHVEQAQDKMELMMIARIDYSKMRAALRSTADSDKKRKMKRGNENDVAVIVGDRHKKYRICDLCKVGSKDQYSNS